MKKEIRFLDKQFSNYNNAIIILADLHTNKDVLINKMSHDWVVMRDDNENKVRDLIKQSNPDQKPNIFITDWVKDGIDFINATFWLNHLSGYDPKNIHLVWKIDSVEMALSTDLGRESYQRIIKLFGDLYNGKLVSRERFDGDVWMVSNESDLQIKSVGNPIEDNLMEMVQ